jgi:hypothetical protein
MPKRVPPLTQMQIRNAKPKEMAYKLADGGGLYLEVTPAGGKHWRMKYRRPDGREAKLNFGAFWPPLWGSSSDCDRKLRSMSTADNSVSSNTMRANAHNALL